MKKLVWHCPYLGLEHLCLLKMGWEETNCLLDADGQTWIKLIFFMEIVHA